MDGLFTATFGIDYSAIKSEADFVHRLGSMVDEGPTITSLPWRLVARFEEFFERSVDSFDYAEFAQFCRAESARNLLRPTMCSADHLQCTAFTRRINFPGIFLEHLRYFCTQYLITAKLPALPDCRSTNPANNLPDGALLPPEVLEARNTVTGIVNHAGLWFQRTVAIIGFNSNRERRIAGREINEWIPGAGAHADLQVLVDIQHYNGHAVIAPRAQEKEDILMRGFRVPLYAVSRALVPVMRHKATPASAAPVRPQVPPAARGPKFVIAANYEHVHDRQTGRQYAVEPLKTALALRAFVEIANGRSNAKSEDMILEHIRRLRAEGNLRPAAAMGLHAYFQCTEKGRKIMNPLYDLLIRNVPRQNLYWLQL